MSDVFKLIEKRLADIAFHKNAFTETIKQHEAEIARFNSLISGLETEESSLKSSLTVLTADVEKKVAKFTKAISKESGDRK